MSKSKRGRGWQGCRDKWCWCHWQKQQRALRAAIRRTKQPDE